MMAEQNNNSSMLAIGTVLRGAYRIERYLSSGGFGNTYVATNLQFDETVAIKEFFMRDISYRDADSMTVSVSSTDARATFQSQLEKFKKEARRLRKLHNPHIVQVHDLFDENGTAYYVMDYIDGMSLRDRLKQQGQPMAEQEIIGNILPQILDALEEVHSLGIYHLDLKPANIMQSKDGSVKLIDFGASKQQSSSGGVTTSSALSYTNGYAPREQMEQNPDKFGPWTDLYALGATLYTLLTDRKPPMPSDIDEDQTPDKHESLPMPSSVSAKTRHLVLWLMATNRKQRPQSVEEVRNYLAGDETKLGDKVEVKVEAVSELPKKADVSEVHVAPQVKVISEGTPPKAAGNKNKLFLIGGIVLVAIVIAVIVLSRGRGSYDAGQDEMWADSVALDTTDVISGIIYNMVYVEGGTFTMGATSEQVSDADEDEKPAHKVTLSSFSIGKFEVTQREWQEVMGSNPSEFKGDDLPVENVSWNDCQEFISKLNNLTGLTFRLPTEAEWEYAARGGNMSIGYKYAGSDDIDDVAWYADNSDNYTHEVGTRESNELGLYDMSGNVVEWCEDWHEDYSSSAQVDPVGSASDIYPYRAMRGGGLYDEAKNCRVSVRYWDSADSSNSTLGFRLAF